MKTRLSTTKDIIFHVLPYVYGRILDLGAGTAKYKTILEKKAASYTACDAKEGKNIDVVCDVINLPFSPESFDTVISTQVFEHVANPFLAAAEIRKVLKSGGHAIITAPFMVPFHPDPEDNFRFSKNGLEEIFKSHHFEIIESGIYGGFFMVLSEIIHFSWFDPYDNKPGQLMGFIEKISKTFDKIFKTENIYANSFVVAKKL